MTKFFAVALVVWIGCLPALVADASCCDEKKKAAQGEAGDQMSKEDMDDCKDGTCPKKAKPTKKSAKKREKTAGL